MPIKNSLLQALYYTSDNPNYDTFKNRVKKECDRALCADEFGSLLGLIPEILPIVLKESTLTLNVHVNDWIIEASIDDDYVRFFALVRLTVLKSMAMTVHALACFTFFCVHALNRIPENIVRFPRITTFLFAIALLIFLITTGIALIVSSGLIASVGISVLCVAILLASVFNQILFEVQQFNQDRNHEEVTSFHCPLFNAWRHFGHTMACPQDRDEAMEMLPIAMMTAT